LFLIFDTLRIKHVASPVCLLNTDLNENTLNLKCVWMETHRDPHSTYCVWKNEKLLTQLWEQALSNESLPSDAGLY